MNTAAAAPVQARYRVTGMDCPSCAAQIESAARKIDGVEHVKVSIVSQVMTLSVIDPPTRLPAVEHAVTDLGYRLTRIGNEDKADENKIPDLTHAQPAYKRALWIVVVLNVGYGVIEIVGGFLAGSQAVKADALDFVGDGLISFLGLIAIGWGLAARARAALLQGVFLAVLGIGIMLNTVYRVFVLNQPEANLMVLLGAVALVVNVAAALVLIPHRTGDANVQAIWLFSRNGAMGNAAVVLAAVLVWQTRSPWPDLAVAGLIGALFLHSAWSIIVDARADMRQVSSRG